MEQKCTWRQVRSNNNNNEYLRTFVLHSLSLWNDVFLSLFLPSTGWMCGVGVFGLIGCCHFLPVLHYWLFLNNYNDDNNNNNNDNNNNNNNNNNLSYSKIYLKWFIFSCVPCSNLTYSWAVTWTVTVQWRVQWPVQWYGQWHEQWHWQWWVDVNDMWSDLGNDMGSHWLLRLVGCEWLVCGITCHPMAPNISHHVTWHSTSQHMAPNISHNPSHHRSRVIT